MTRDCAPRSGMALGGIGAGWFELRQDGRCYNWSIFNNAPLWLGAPLRLEEDSMLFFAIRFQEQGKEPMIRVLQIEGDYGLATIDHHPHYYIFPWLAGVDKIDYCASFPFARLVFTDRDMPLRVELEAWSPFIPNDVKNSALPAAVFDLRITSTSHKPVDVMVLGSMRNAVAFDVPRKTYRSDVISGKGWRGCEMTCDGIDAAHASAGTLALACVGRTTSHYLGWEHIHPYYERVLRAAKLPDIDDTDGRNAVDTATGERRAMARCFSTVAATARLTPAQRTCTPRFIAAWHFPNQYAEKPAEGSGHAPDLMRNEGHYYSNHFARAADVVAYVGQHAPHLHERTRAFHHAFFSATVEPYVLDQVNSQLNTFFTSTWLTKAGDFGVLEGLDKFQSYAGLCTLDVAMYGGVATAALFPELDRAALRAHRRLQHDSGIVAHSISRNFGATQARELGGTRVDLPGQFIYLTLRAWAWNNDLEFLREQWSAVQRALEYVLRERDKNGDMLPDMEGIMCSYDNFAMYGVSSFVGAQWLAALALAVDAAEALHDTAAAQRYRAALETGRAAFMRATWTGRYFRLYNDVGGTHGADEGCLTDQLLGQWAAELVGHHELLDPAKVRGALRHIMQTNYHPRYGVRNCTWPGDVFLHEIGKDTWVDQANTCWTGAELAFAGLLLYAGLYHDALRVIKNVDARHKRDGIYWDHKEFGGHYFRPMAAWGILHGLLGLAVNNLCYTFAPCVPANPLALLFVCDGCVARFTRQVRRAGETVRIEVLSGTWRVRALELTLARAKAGAVALTAGARGVPAKQYGTRWLQGRLTLAFATPLQVKAGTALTLDIR
ncbi:MAG: GH116 family glycosyl hydrolase [bacterium]|nr:GH116 family glycosyl hydrolase [bacterium]